MKQSNSCWAVNLTALVLAAGLLMGLFTGCFGLIGPKHPKPELKTEKVTITIKGDDGVTVNEPKTLEIAKDTKWSEIKTKVEEKLSYKTNYEAAGFRLDSESCNNQRKKTKKTKNTPRNTITHYVSILT